MLLYNIMSMITAPVAHPATGSRPTPSLLMRSAGERLAGALTLAAALWGLVWWALA